MGNNISESINGEEFNNLQELYKMTSNQIKSLQKQLESERNENKKLRKEIIDTLKYKNNLVKDHVPNNRYNDVNNFINNLEMINQDNVSKKSNNLNTNINNNNNNNNMNQSYKMNNNTSNNTNTEKKSNKFDPYKIFKLNKKFTENELKESYKKLVLIFHPDRPKGSIAHFRLITKAYNQLLEKLKLEKDDKQYLDLKNESADFIKNQKNLKLKNKDLKEFNLNKFNNFFTENKFDTPEDSGYNDWIKSNYLEEKDIERIDGSFTNNKFNNLFEKNVKVSNEIIEYKVPQPIVSNPNCHELGVDKITDFSGNGYTDYRKAHTQTRIIDPSNVNFKKYKDIKELNKERKNISPLNDTEMQLLEQDKRDYEDLQNKRHYNQKNMDGLNENRYNKIHKMMIENIYN